MCPLLVPPHRNARDRRAHTYIKGTCIYLEIYNNRSDESIEREQETGLACFFPANGIMGCSFKYQCRMCLRVSECFLGVAAPRRPLPLPIHNNKVCGGRLAIIKSPAGWMSHVTLPLTSVHKYTTYLLSPTSSLLFSLSPQVSVRACDSKADRRFCSKLNGFSKIVISYEHSR
jgi:hypothetical protein